MFNCLSHGWSHIEIPCPLCTPIRTYTSSGTEMSEEPKSVVYYELRDTITQLRRENERMREALESIAFAEQPHCDGQQYWLNETHEQCAETLAGDTQIAREALKDCEGLK